MVAQQYVLLESGCALLDAYFPQFNIGIEVDEAQHKTEINHVLDKKRERDVIRAIGCTVLRVDVTRGISEIHMACDQIVSIIKHKMMSSTYDPWNIESEYGSKRHIDRGYISVNDNVAFRKQIHALECFGIYYKSSWTGGETHPTEDDVHIWFPKIHARRDWINELDENEETIYEKNEDSKKNEETINKWITSKRTKRYVFVYSKDSLGLVLYRFKGVFELDKAETLNRRMAVWRKICDTVVTTLDVLKGKK